MCSIPEGMRNVCLSNVECSGTMTTPREVLLVGEGNFSFSAALCQASLGGAKVTATCFFTQEAALRQDGAADNLQRLQDCGAEVHFEVDGTCLQECAAFKGRLFDCIVFNFPHCGRKSGVKKNRNLLAKFFLSCVQMLKDGGEIHVALCNGQGGTPVDKPMREWHNSWQAVAMAAEAGLILSEICPFDHKKYQGYRCTGYRSQDKGFHMEGALNHVFTRSLPCAAPQSMSMETTVGRETVRYEFPQELCEFANRNFLGPQSHHPVQRVKEQLLKELQSVWPVHVVDMDFPELFRRSADNLHACGPGISSSDIYWIRPTETCVLGQEEKGTEEDGEPDGNQDSPMGGFGLRPSLLLHVQEIIQNRAFQPEVLHALSGLVFQRVPVCRSVSPAFHQLLLTGAFPAKSQPIQQIKNCLQSLLSPHGIAFEENQGSGVQELWVNTKSPFKVGRLEAFPATGDGPQSQQLCVATFNLDLLSVHIFDVADWRLLWSADPRFLPRSPRPFRTFSLYPPVYTHDISFWVEPEGFDELAFHSLVRRVSAGTVKEVVMVDRFRHPHMGHASLCYRLTYQSPDRALSHSQASGMQLQLRRLLPTELRVTLR